MTSEKSRLQIAVVDDHNLFRKGLIKLINMGDKHNRYSILFEAENGLEMKDKLQKDALPDIILMDIDMPDMDGFEAVAWLGKYHPDISILVVSMLETEAAILRMVKLGVKGYLSKDIEVEDMHAALDKLADKKTYYSALVSQAMADSIKSGTPPDSAKEGQAVVLSENEREFIKLACTEMTYQQIADKMHLSPKTIDGYREALFARFSLKSRVGLAMYAIRNGLAKL